jgi:signal peptidase I
MYGAGTAATLALALWASLLLWIAIPWTVLDWSPTLVRSGSMEPVVSTGDVVLLQTVATPDIGPNTVVAFRSGTGRTLHRVVDRTSDGRFVTQGDANPVPDSEPVRPADVEGAAVLVIPWIGQPAVWLADGHWPALALAAAALVLAVAVAPRAFDPRYDPWHGVQRTNPAELLLGPRDRWDASALAPRHLVTTDQLAQVFVDLDVQSRTVDERITQLTRGAT